MLKHAVVLCALVGCTGASSTGIEELSCPPDSQLTYVNFGAQFVSDNCLECHDTRNPRLSTQEQIRAKAASILDEAVYTDAMPEGSDMSIADRTKFGEWLACGAP